MRACFVAISLWFSVAPAHVLAAPTTQTQAQRNDLAAFDALIAGAHEHGLKVIVDQVLSHTSDQHEWFKQSRVDRENDKADWYVWADAKADGSPPNNWLSIFGGSAWEWDTSRCQYYLHNFLKSQPDLNFHNRDVQDAILETVRFWLERGVDGFRLDTINFYFHSADLKDNPALAPENRNDSIAPAVNPYNYQDHLHDKNQPENLVFLQRFRSLLNEYPATAAVGEVGDAQYGLELVADYTSGDDKVQMCYSFDFLSKEPLTPKRVQDVVEAFEEKAPDGWSCWAFSNHDVVRHASRWADGIENRDAFLKLTANLILSLRGSVCLYQGEELGLSEEVLDFEDLQDPYGIQFWPTFKGRDGCRTPMVWNSGNMNAGFSEVAPWLPVPPEHIHSAVSEQEQASGSLLNHYRDVLALVGEDQLDSVFMWEHNPHLNRWFYTDPAYMWYRNVFLELASDEDCVTYNCTGGGILFGHPIRFLSLATFLSDVL